MSSLSPRLGSTDKKPSSDEIKQLQKSVFEDDPDEKVEEVPEIPTLDSSKKRGALSSSTITASPIIVVNGNVPSLSELNEDLYFFSVSKKMDKNNDFSILFKNLPHKSTIEEKDELWDEKKYINLLNEFRS